jgi:hypothetical protein
MAAERGVTGEAQGRQRSWEGWDWNKAFMAAERGRTGPVHGRHGSPVWSLGDSGRSGMMDALVRVDAGRGVMMCAIVAGESGRRVKIGTSVPGRVGPQSRRWVYGHLEWRVASGVPFWH